MEHYYELKESDKIFVQQQIGDDCEINAAGRVEVAKESSSNPKRLERGLPALALFVRDKRRKGYYIHVINLIHKTKVAETRIVSKLQYTNHPSKNVCHIIDSPDQNPHMPTHLGLIFQCPIKAKIFYDKVTARIKYLQDKQDGKLEQPPRTASQPEDGNIRCQENGYERHRQNEPQRTDEKLLGAALRNQPVSRSPSPGHRQSRDLQNFSPDDPYKYRQSPANCQAKPGPKFNPYPNKQSPVSRETLETTLDPQKTVSNFDPYSYKKHGNLNMSVSPKLPQKNPLAPKTSNSPPPEIYEDEQLIQQANETGKPGRMELQDQVPPSITAVQENKVQPKGNQADSKSKKFKKVVRIPKQQQTPAQDPRQTLNESPLPPQPPLRQEISPTRTMEYPPHPSLPARNSGVRRPDIVETTVPNFTGHHDSPHTPTFSDRNKLQKTGATGDVTAQTQEFMKHDKPAVKVPSNGYPEQKLPFGTSHPQRPTNLEFRNKPFPILPKPLLKEKPRGTKPFPHNRQQFADSNHSTGRVEGIHPWQKKNPVEILIPNHKERDQYLNMEVSNNNDDWLPPPPPIIEPETSNQRWKNSVIGNFALPPPPAESNLGVADYSYNKKQPLSAQTSGSSVNSLSSNSSDTPPKPFKKKVRETQNCNGNRLEDPYARNSSIQRRNSSARQQPNREQLLDSLKSKSPLSRLRKLSDPGHQKSNGKHKQNGQQNSRSSIKGGGLLSGLDEVLRIRKMRICDEEHYCGVTATDGDENDSEWDE